MTMTVAIRRGDGTVMCARCTVAETLPRRMRGLLGKAALEPGEGLLLRPAPAIQTWFLRFPIDAVFLDRDLSVVLTKDHLRPFRTASHHRARSVLQLAAGETRRHGIVIGERLRIVWPDEELSRSSASEGSGRRGRVAVSTPDPRFLRVASFLLERHNFSVVPHRTQGELLEDVRRGRADVALIDATGSLTAAARLTRAIEGLDPTVAVVVVADETGEAPKNLPLLDKWASFTAIVDRIEAVSAETASAA